MLTREFIFLFSCFCHLMKEEIKKSRYIPHGVCSRYIDLTISDGVITEIYIDGGCRGNLQGICSLVTCRTVKEVIEKSGHKNKIDE